MRRIKALILAAGLGTRLKPLTDRMPKCLVPLAGRPLLAYWLDQLADAGIRDIMINTHGFPTQIREVTRRHVREGCFNIVEHYEPTLLGSAGTITATRAFADDADCIVVLYADNLSDADLCDMLAYHASHADPLTMLLFQAADPGACGIATLDAHDRIVKFQEKPAHPKSNLANGGVYIVDAAVYREIADMNAFDIGFDVLPQFISRMRGWTWRGYHRDIGTFPALRAAQDPARDILVHRGFGDDGTQPAVFLDRDGTIIRDMHHLTDPQQVRLLPGAATAIHLLRCAGYRCVVVSNQSAVGRGMMTTAQLRQINSEMCRQLALHGAVLDGIYWNAAVPRTTDRAVIEYDDRKPGPGMLRRAASELRLRLEDSWMIGDMVSDVLAGNNAGCCGSILIGPNAADERDHLAAPDLLTAVRMVLEQAHPSRAINQQARKEHFVSS